VISQGPHRGSLSVRLEDLLNARKEAGRDWWPLSGCKSGRLRLTVEWKPLNMAGGIHGADQYVPPIGAVRLWLKKATDVKNVEAALGGKVRRICEHLVVFLLIQTGRRLT
jgi:Ca2+-dependent lipid-binding protein